MSAANTVVETILKSPAHPILSTSMVLVQYVGNRSGDEHMLPVKYADTHHGLVVMVGKPETKSWWRNFTKMGQARGAPEGHVDTDDRPRTARGGRSRGGDATAALLRERYPKIVKSIEGDTLEERVENAVVVWFRPAN